MEVKGFIAQATPLMLRHCHLKHSKTNSDHRYFAALHHFLCSHRASPSQRHTSHVHSSFLPACRLLFPVKPSTPCLCPSLHIPLNPSVTTPTHLLNTRNSQQPLNTSHPLLRSSDCRIGRVGAGEQSQTIISRADNL